MHSIMQALKAYVAKSPLPLRLVQEIRMELHLATVRLRGRFDPRLRRRATPLRELHFNEAIHLHFGCGRKILKGWVNIDGWDGPGVDYVCDLRQPLPLRDAACRLIYAEHVLEHIDPQFRDQVLRELHRLLTPDGTLRIVGPSCELFAKAYARGDKEWLRRAAPGYPTRAAALNQIFLNHFHRFIDDLESLTGDLLKAGFTDVKQSSHQGSKISDLRIDLDEPSRVISNLYIEAKK